MPDGYRSKDLRPDDGGPAFPAVHPMASPGLSTLDYFAIHGPTPSYEDMRTLAELDRSRNPHGDPHKPKVRSLREIEWDIRYRWAAEGIAARARYMEGTQQ